MPLLKSLKKEARQPIEKLQGRLKIDLFYLIKGEFWLVIGKGVTMTASFCLSLAWANWISKEVYGHYQYVLSLISIISIFSLPEIEGAVVQAVARGLEGTFITALKTQLKWGALASLSALGIAGYYWSQGNLIFPIAFLLVAISIPLFNAATIYNGFLMGKRMFKAQVKYDVLSQVVATSIMALNLFVIKKFLPSISAHIVVAMIVGTYLISRTILYSLILIIIRIKFKPNTKEDPTAISFGKHLTASSIIDTIASSLDSVLLFNYLGPANLAVYSFAVLGPQQLKTILKHISDLSLPKFAVRSRKEIRETILSKILYLSLLMSCLVLIYIIAAPFLYRIFFPKYLAAVPYSQIYALSSVPLCFSLGSVFRAKKMIREIYQIRIWGPIVRIVLFLFLIPTYGIWGAVIAVLGTRVFNAALALYFQRKI